MGGHIKRVGNAIWAKKTIFLKKHKNNFEILSWFRHFVVGERREQNPPWKAEKEKMGKYNVLDANNSMTEWKCEKIRAKTKNGWPRFDARAKQTFFCSPSLKQIIKKFQKKRKTTKNSVVNEENGAEK